LIDSSIKPSRGGKHDGKLNFLYKLFQDYCTQADVIVQEIERMLTIKAQV